MADKLKRRRERLARAARGEEAVQTAAAAAPRQAKRRRRRGRVSRKARTQFTTQFATLQDAGLPILRSLRILQAQMPEGPMRDVVATMAEDVEGGTSLSEAMAKHPQVFDDLYTNMMRAGEAGGALTTILNRQADYMERQDAMIRRVRGALIYPVIVSVVAVGILIFIMVVVVPKFEQAFTQMGSQLPGMTQMLIDASRWIQEHWFVLLAVPFLIWGLLVLVGRTKGGRRALDTIKLKLWVFGPIAHHSQVGRFARTLGTLSSSGVPLLQSLDITRDASGNVVTASAVDKVREAVKEGESLAQPMAETGMFDEIVVNMVDVGEETGELDRMLGKIADNEEAEVSNRIAAGMSVLEPAIIVIMGLIVGFIVVSLFLPLIEMQKVLGY